MSRNILFVVIGALAALAAVAGYVYYEGQQDGVNIQIDEHGVSIDGN